MNHLIFTVDNPAKTISIDDFKKTISLNVEADQSIGDEQFDAIAAALVKALEPFFSKT